MKYDFDNKSTYRARRASAIERIRGGNPRAQRVAYLDTSDALDTMFYLRRGYQPKNLWAVNDNPAHCAHITMKCRAAGFEPVNTVGLDFVDALHRRIPDVDVVDFDGIGNYSDRLTHTLFQIAKCRPDVVLCATIMGARETDAAREMVLQDFIETRYRTSFNTVASPRHSTRAFLALSAICGYDNIDFELDQCCVHVRRVIWDIYISESNQPMIWIACDLRAHDESAEKAAREWYAAARKCPIPIPLDRCVTIDPRTQDRFFGVPCSVADSERATCSSQIRIAISRARINHWGKKNKDPNFNFETIERESGRRPLQLPRIDWQ